MDGELPLADKPGWTNCAADSRIAQAAQDLLEGTNLSRFGRFVSRVHAYVHLGAKSEITANL